MPSSMTFQSLTTDLASYAERSDTAFMNQIPRFIMMAEQSLATSLKVLGNQMTANGTLIPGQSIVAKPDGWRETVSINVTNAAGAIVPLLPRLPEMARQVWPNPALTGFPRFYSEVGFNQWLLTPTPDAAYKWQILYNARLEPLDATNSVNWFTENAPALLLYSCFAQVELWLKNAAAYQQWQAVFDKERQAFIGEDARRIADRTTLAVEPQE